MSIETISKIIGVQTAMKNLQLQQMTAQKRNMELVAASRDFEYDEKTRAEREALEDMTRTNLMKAQAEKVSYDSLSPEMRVQMEDAKKYGDLRSASTYINQSRPVETAMTPGRTESQKTVRDANLSFTDALLAQNGVSVDQRDYFKETSANNQALADGGEPTMLSYADIPSTSQSMISAVVPGYEPQEIFSVADDMQAKIGTFRALASNTFQTDYENNQDLTSSERVNGAIETSLERMGVDIESDPDTANAFIQSGLDSIMKYRESEGSSNLKSLEGMVGLNLIAARDGINKFGFDISMSSPSEMIMAMEENLGFRQSMQIAQASGMIEGGEAPLYSSLAKYVKKMNPLVNDDSITEFDRKKLVKQAYLDVLSNKVAGANMDQAQRITMVKMIDDIAKQVDRNNIEPELNKNLEQVYKRFTEGYSTYGAEKRRVENIALQANNGTISDLNGKQLRTAGNFAGYVDDYTGDDKIIAQEYKRRFDAAASNGGFEFVKQVSTRGGDVADFSSSNQSWYAGTLGNNSVNVGLMKMMDGIVRKDPIEKISPAFKSPEAREAWGKMERNISKLSIVADKGLMRGLFMKADRDNPIKNAGIELEKFDGYYIPESVGATIDAGGSSEISNLINTALNSNLGSDAVLGAVAHLYQIQAQGAADVFNKQLVAVGTDMYPDSMPNSRGGGEKLFTVAMRDEQVLIENQLPFLSDGSVEFSSLTDQDKESMTKFREGLEMRTAKLQAALSRANTTSTEGQRALFTGTAAENIGTNYETTINVLSDFEEVLKGLESLPSPDAYIAPAGRGYESLGSSKVVADISKKRVDLSARLQAIIDVMNKAQK